MNMAKLMMNKRVVMFLKKKGELWWWGFELVEEGIVVLKNVAKRVNEWEEMKYGGTIVEEGNVVLKEVA
jgi:hypothetical protein